ncbi:polymorphic toxin type 5 domain-containing protein [Streptomyces sp. NBC_00203]|uniref:polymorphic toxin type 5 domain-containing protein n=1 Tax=Streptomyces sp. NBC_00203 TaxID=2975680 RepID=UPI0032439500
MTERSPTELLGNRRIGQLLHGADAPGLAGSDIGNATGTPLPVELAARLAAVVRADPSRVRPHRGEQTAQAPDTPLGDRLPQAAGAGGVAFSYSVRISSLLDSDGLLIEFIKQYRGVATDQEAGRIRDQEQWKWTGTAPTVTDAHVRHGYILIPVTDRSVTPATEDERRQCCEFLTGLSSAEQEAFDAETDRRFWERTQYRVGQRLGGSPDDRAMAPYWMVLRDDLIRQRQAIAALSPDVRAVLGEENLQAVRHDDYPTLLRVADKLAQLSPAELAEYRGRVTASTTHWGELEASVDRFIAERQERQAATQEREQIVTQLYGLRELYQRYRLYMSMVTNNTAILAPSGGAGAMSGLGMGTGLGNQPTINRMRSELEADLAPYGGIAGFKALVRRYEQAYEQETLAIARVMLDQYEHTLYEQAQRYQTTTADTQLHRAVAVTGARQHYEEAEREARTSMAYGGSVPESPTMDDLALEHASRSATAHQQGETAVRSIAGTHPLVANADFDRERLARAEPGEAGPMMREYIAARRRDIAETRRNLADRPTLIYQLDALMTASYQSQRIAPDSVYDLIIRDHARDVAIREAIPDIVLAVVAIAAGLLSGGTGTVAVAAAGTALGIGAYQAVEEFRRYETRSEAHGAQLLSDDPTFAWVVVALIGVGLDAAAVASLLRGGGAMRPAVEAFNQTGDVAAFRRQLLANPALEESIRTAATRAAEAEAEARAAWRSILRPTQDVLYAVPIPGTVEFGKLVYAVYLSIRRGIREFELFLHTRQAAELGLDAARFAAPEMAQDLATLKNSYLRAIADMDTVRAHAQTLGLGERETNAFLRMWGERPTPMTAEQVAQEMDAWNTMRQQGLPSTMSSAEETAPVTLKASVLPHYSSKPAFMEAMRRRLLAQRASGKPSLLDFLLDADGQWQKGSFVARSGRPMRGRYALSDPNRQIVQAGHMQSDWYAKVMSRREYLMLEDADLNWMTGSAEAAGSVTSKPAVLIENYPVDIPTARLWEAHGKLPAGTVSAAPVVEPPAF